MSKEPKVHGPPEMHRRCKDILTQLKGHPSARKLISSSNGLYEPVNLDAVEEKAKKEMYAKFENFVADVRQVWKNSWEKSGPGSEAYIATTELSEYFEGLIKDTHSMPGIKNSATFDKKEIREFSEAKKATTERNMPPPERQKRLIENISKFPSEKAEELIKIIGKNRGETVNGLFEFDIKDLSHEKFLELEYYVDGCIQEQNRKKEIASKKEVI